MMFICRLWKKPGKRTKFNFWRKVFYLFCKEYRGFFYLVHSNRPTSHPSAYCVLSPLHLCHVLLSPSPFPALLLPTICPPKYNPCKDFSAHQPFKIFFIIICSYFCKLLINLLLQFFIVFRNLIK